MMGLFALLSWDHTGAALLQMLSSMVKVPLLFLLTLLITFPSLYVLSALARTRLGAAQTARLLLVAITVDLALLASFGPILAFFTLSTDSYPFMKLLNVLIFAIAGLAGLTFLNRALRRWLGQTGAESHETGELEPAPAEAESKTPDAFHDSLIKKTVGLIEQRQSHLATQRTRRLIVGWCVLFGIVGSQMGWVLRPFLGDPDQPFELFRARSSNFLEAVFTALGRLLS
ncbi:MAG TPA: hypothetical protein P5218_09925 [Planctomycetota bacterium]|nr:hypothetical protein [Planctomycetota bacterium]